MRITKSALSLNVPDVACASAQFVQDHFGFSEVMAADLASSSLASEARASTSSSYVPVWGASSLNTPPEARVKGLLVVFEVDEIDDSTRGYWRVVPVITPSKPSRGASATSGSGR